MKENIEVTRLANGLTILTEKMPDVRSATLGFFYKIGSRNEIAPLNGICHFIEHCVFKGTEKRSALDIAIETDRLGGNFDAFTSQEETGFTIKTIDSKVPRAFELLADILTNPCFEQIELKREQKVILEEMKMVEDTPEELLTEIFYQTFFPNHPLGRSIAGTRQTVRSFDSEKTKEFFDRFFQSQNLVIAAAGNVEHKEIIRLAQLYFPATNKIDSSFPQSSPPEFSAGIKLKTRNLEQTHFMLATPFVKGDSPSRYAANLLSVILGGGTSSRLWQKIREEKGLAYSVGASSVTFQDCGIFQIFAATSPKNFPKTVELSLAELRRIKLGEVSETELQLAKDQIYAAILLGLEDSSARVGNLVSCELTHGAQIPLETTLQNIEKVTVKEIQELARKYFVKENIALVGLGDFRKQKVKELNV